MTGLTATAKTHSVGRKMEWPEKFLAAFAEGTLARLKAVMREGEDQRAVIRAALDRELSRREREAKRKP